MGRAEGAPKAPPSVLYLVPEGRDVSNWNGCEVLQRVVVQRHSILTFAGSNARPAPWGSIVTDTSESTTARFTSMEALAHRAAASGPASSGSPGAVSYTHLTLPTSDLV